MMHKKFNTGLESIHFQTNPLLFKELTLYFERLREYKKESDLVESGMLADFTKIVNSKVGLSIVLNVEVGYGPAIVVPDVKKNHVLYNTARQNFASNAEASRMIAKSGEVIRGTVDLRTSKVSGAFAELQATMYYPSDMIIGSKFTPAEVAAICLHEIGHFFTYLEYISRTVRTNAVMAGVSKGLSKAESAEERETIIATAKDALKLKNLDVKEAAENKNNSVTELVILTSIAETTRDEVGQNIYDLNTWEYLCDEFAARHGAGRSIATALDKLYRSYGHIATRSFPTFLGVEALKFSALFGSIVLTAAGGFVGGIVGEILLTVTMAMFTADGLGSTEYDRPQQRIMRVRNQLIEQLKDKTLPSDIQKQMLEDLAVVDNLVENMNSRLQLTNVIWNFFSKNQRTRLAQEKLARELESLATSKLFAQAAALNNL